jgi:protein gp37
MSGISWTDKTWNPIVGCSKVSAGCDNCWAERMAKRTREFPEGWDGNVHLFPNRLVQPLRWRKPRRIAVGLMGDLFHDSASIDFQEKVFRAMCSAPRHTFQVLTKRAKVMRKNMTVIMNRIFGYHWRMPDNIWLGVSCENQAAADERIPLLLQTPAAVRFVSCEPLLSEIDLDDYLYPVCIDPEGHHGPEDCVERAIDWVIAGAESGPGRRSSDIQWFRSLRDQCMSADVAFHLKQIEANGIITKAPALDNTVWLEFPRECR